MTGFETAFEEITLVLFTTLAPSGVIAYCLIAFAYFLSKGEEANRLNAMLLMPFLVCLAGLVASATHLGNPDNALYVFARVGHSPLSTEVFAAVMFLGAAGTQWLCQFAEHARKRILDALLVVAIVAGFGFLAAMSVAYSSRTIITWYTPLVPLSLVLNSLVGGPILTFAGLVFARSRFASGVAAKALIVLSFGGLAANLTVYAARAMELADVGNGLFGAYDLVPGFQGMILMFAALSLAAMFIDFSAARAGCTAVSDDAGYPKLVRVKCLFAIALSFSGIFIMRFAFYMTHMTVGISL